MSTALIVIDSVAVMAVLATEVAVMVAVVVTDTLAGAVNTTVVGVLLLNEPGPERAPGYSLIILVIGDRGGDSYGLPGVHCCAGGGRQRDCEVLWLPEQPAKTSAQTRIPTASNERALSFLTVSPMKVVTISPAKQQLARMRIEPASQSSGWLNRMSTVRRRARSIHRIAAN